MSPEASLRTWVPAIHAGMTKLCISSSADERKIMNHFVVVYSGWLGPKGVML
jgi:hypothetical protein